MSDDYVLDASAVVLALIGKDDAAEALRQRLPAMRRHAPHLVDAEVGNVLRQHVRSGRVSAQEAELAFRANRVLVEHRYSHLGPLTELAWTWRANVSFYAALYVALAVLLDAPLITADSTLAKAAGRACAFDLV